MDEPTVGGGLAVPGARIGSYRLLQPIGVGGMGEVWLAEQERPIRRKVAFKLIKAGLDTERVIARFEAERQALALMEHPAIARVLDAGSTPQGRPYFVMEYVQGVSITDYCDEHRLDTSARLQLFARVCEGVQHAHQKAVIHRDLKPSNVLVTEVDGQPVPKIIDFGVAKATASWLAESATVTEFGHMIGTPAYMSPEQAQLTGDDIDTRSDVYSLGVLLYELLVGALPFDAAELGSHDFESLRRVILLTDPPRPSSRVTTLGERATPLAASRRSDPIRLATRLRGDLDWIVLKALEKERSRRYATALDLSSDIQRHLRNEPVLARPPSARYRMRKFVRRNRGTVTAAAAVLLVLLLGVAASTAGFVRARQAERLAAAEAAEANRQAATAQAINRFLNNDLLAAVAPSARQGRGRDVLMKDVLDVASENIEAAADSGGSLADEPRVESAIRSTLARTYRSLGEYDAADRHYRRAIELQERFPDDRHALASAMADLGLTSSYRGRYAEAESLFVRSIELRMREAQVDTVRQLVPTAFNLATLYQRQGRYVEAESLFVPMLATLRRIEGEDNDRTLMVKNNLANLYQEVGRLPEAENLQTQVLDARRRQEGEEGPSTLMSMNNLANIYSSQGRIDDAADLLVRTLELKRRVLGPEHPSTLNTLSSYASISTTRGEYAEAERLHRETLELRGRVLGPRHPMTQATRNDLALVVLRQGRWAEATALADTTVATCRAELGDAHDTTWTARLILALCQVGAEELEAAERTLREVLGEIEARETVDPALANLVEAHLGLVLGQRREREEAVVHLDRSLDSLPLWENESRLVLQKAIQLYDSWEAEDPGGGWLARGRELRAQMTRARSAEAGGSRERS